MIINLTSSKKTLFLSGVVLGILACILVYFGNPKNMVVCVACFIGDSTDAMKLHTAVVVQYSRLEIVGFVCGSFLIALVTRGYRPTAGSSPMLRFILGVIMMIGSPAFLGCSLRMVICMVAGDLNAYVGFLGFAAGVLTGTIASKHEFSLEWARETGKINGATLPVVLVVLFVLSLTTTLFAFGEKGPGSMRAPALLAPAVALLSGAIAQKRRTCFAGSIRDVILMRNFDSITVIGGLFAVMLVFNLATGGLKLFFAGQLVAHPQHIWNILGLYVVGFAAVLAGGCPLRQLVLVGQGSSDSAVTSLGLLVGAVFCHNFGLAASAAAAAIADAPAAPGGLAVAGKAVVIGCVAILLIIGPMPEPQEGKQEVKDTYEVDVRDLSCPEPVMLTTVAFKKHKGEPVKVLVSGSHTRMNVEKYVKSQGKTATVTKKGSELEIVVEQYRCPGFAAHLNQDFWSWMLQWKGIRLSDHLVTVCCDIFQI